MTLLEKLNNITEELGGLGKGGTNAHNKYKYVKAEDSMKAFRELEVKHRIKVLPMVDTSTIKVEKTEKGQITTAVVNFSIHDLDSNNTFMVSILSQGYDSTDKSAFKLMTGAFKYFLLQTFSFSTDDPEKDDERIAGHTTGKADVKEPTSTSGFNVSNVAPTEEKAPTSTNRFKVSKALTAKPATEKTELVASVFAPSVHTEVPAAAGTTTVTVTTNSGNGSAITTKPTFKTGKFAKMLAESKGNA